MLDTAFDALKKYDWGTDLSALNPIEDAIVAAHGQAESQRELESRLTAALAAGLSLDGQEYVCRKLAVLGSAASVPALAGLLDNPHISHMARFALEQIPGNEASKALRDSLAKVSGNLKIGVFSSIGSRRDNAAVAALAEHLTDSNPAIAKSAAQALGAIGSSDAVAALQKAAAAASSAPVIDALLSCAESLLVANKTSEANAIYQTFAQDSQPRLVRLAAMRGLLACSGKQA